MFNGSREELHFLMMGIQYPRGPNTVTEHQWRIDSIETPGWPKKSLKSWQTHLFGTTG